MSEIETRTDSSWGRRAEGARGGSFLNIFNLFIFREGMAGRKRERNVNVWLPLVHPLLGTWPTTQACALTGNRTNDLLVCLQAGIQSVELPQPGLGSVYRTLVPSPGLQSPDLVTPQSPAS